jgi:hypothetical protein
MQRAMLMMFSVTQCYVALIVMGYNLVKHQVSDCQMRPDGARAQGWDYAITGPSSAQDLKGNVSVTGSCGFNEL